MDTSMIERLTAHSAPTRLPIEGDPNREQRNWIVRLASDLPARLAEDVGRTLAAAASAAVREARTARHVDQAAAEAVVDVRLSSIDERHLIVSITTVRLDRDDAHAWLVAASASLRALESSVPLEDIQGIPRRFWKLVVGAEGGASPP